VHTTVDRAAKDRQQYDQKSLFAYDLPYQIVAIDRSPTTTGN
jgi:hypothetical protein